MPNGELMSAYIALVPSFRGAGAAVANQMGPQVRAASARLGIESGAVLGANMAGSASKQVGGFFTESARMAIKNVTIYGSMYAAIQGVRVGISSMFDDMVGFNAELEQAEIGFTTLLGSAAAAQDQMQWIKDFAKESPFRYDNLVGYAQQLIALGFDAEQSRKVLIAAGDAAAALGRGDESIGRINLALGQMWTKGKVQSQEMLQLTEAGIGAWQILAEKYGASVAEVQDAVTRGLITAKEAVPALIAGMEDQFGGLMDAQAKTFSGVWSNIQDTIQQDLADAGEPLFEQLKSAGQEFLAGLDDPAVKELLQEFGSDLADTARVVLQAGEAAANAFKDAYPFLKEIWSNTKQSLPVLVTMVATFYALRKATAGGFGVGMFSAVIAESKAAAAAVTTVTTPTRAMIAANQAAVRASLDLGMAKSVEADAVRAAAAAEKVSSTSSTAGLAAAKASIAAQRNLSEASLARSTANLQLVTSENAATAATERAVIAQKRLAAAEAGFKKFAGIGQTLGLLGLAASVTAVGDASASTEQKVAGVASAFGTGALLGASFGAATGGIMIPAGAAIGAVVGLTTALVNLQQAQDAANKDTSQTQQMLEKLGVTAATAAELLNSIGGNDKLDSLGGSQAIIDAVQKGGGAYDELVAKLRAVKAANDAIVDDPGAWTWGSKMGQGVEDAKKASDDAAEALKGLHDAATDAAYAQFLATEGSNAATGAYGEQARLAYENAMAIGTIPPALQQTGIAAEGASGKVGFLLAALTGLPVNTPINFSTNATDILAKIYQMQAAIASLRANGDARIATQVAEQMRQLQRDLANSLTSSASITPTLSLPSGGLAKAVGGAASAAADKLKGDREAQLRFADAFGTLMEDALEGDFDRYRDKLADQIKSLTRDGYTKAADELKRLSSTLTQASLDYAALTNKIKTASDAEDDLTKKMRDQYQATVEMVKGLGSATDAQSFDQLTYLLGETASAATSYQDVLTKLKDAGLTQDLWDQLAQAGPQSMGLAQSILAQGQSGIDQLNSLSGSLVDAADSMGNLVADSMYQQGVGAMDAYIAGLRSQAEALESQLVQIGNNVLDKTAGAVTPGNAGYAPVSAEPKQIIYQFGDITIKAESLGDIKKVQDFIQLLDSAPTTQLVNAAGTVIS